MNKAENSPIPEETGIVSDTPTVNGAVSPSFDYSGLDSQTMEDLRLAENEVRKGRRMAEMGLRRMAEGVAIAHDALCGSSSQIATSSIVHNVDNGQFTKKEDTFRLWCESVGVGKTTAYKLLQVTQLFDQSSPNQQKVLEELSPSLLYAAAKPSAPAELVQAVKDGDITTHKEYQELLAKYREEQERADDLRDAAEAMRRDFDVANRRAVEAEGKAKTAQHNLDNQKSYLESLKSQLSSERDRSSAYKGKMDRLDAENKALKARPVEVAVQMPGEEDIRKYRQEGYKNGYDAAAKDFQDALNSANERTSNAISAAANAIPSDSDLYRLCDHIADQLDFFTDEIRTKFSAAEISSENAYRFLEMVFQSEYRFWNLLCDLNGGEPDEDDFNLPD